MTRNRRKPLANNRAARISHDAYFTKTQSMRYIHGSIVEPSGQNLILKCNMTIGYARESDYKEKRTPLKITQKFRKNHQNKTLPKKIFYYSRESHRNFMITAPSARKISIYVPPQFVSKT